MIKIKKKIALTVFALTILFLTNYVSAISIYADNYSFSPSGYNWTLAHDLSYSTSVAFTGLAVGDVYVNYTVNHGLAIGSSIIVDVASGSFNGLDFCAKGYFSLFNYSSNSFQVVSGNDFANSWFYGNYNKSYILYSDFINNENNIRSRFHVDFYCSDYDWYYNETLFSGSYVNLVSLIPICVQSSCEVTSDSPSCSTPPLDLTSFAMNDSITSITMSNLPNVINCTDTYNYSSYNATYFFNNTGTVIDGTSTCVYSSDFGGYYSIYSSLVNDTSNSNLYIGKSGVFSGGYFNFSSPINNTFSSIGFRFKVCGVYNATQLNCVGYCDYRTHYVYGAGFINSDGQCDYSNATKTICNTVCSNDGSSCGNLNPPILTVNSNAQNLSNASLAFTGDFVILIMILVAYGAMEIFIASHFDFNVTLVILSMILMIGYFFTSVKSWAVVSGIFGMSYFVHSIKLDRHVSGKAGSKKSGRYRPRVGGI